MPTTMKTIITDAGRSESSFPFEYNDCTVRALAIANGISYDMAHSILAFYGRKNRKGFKSAKGLPKVTRKRPCRRSGTVGRFARENPVGRFYVQVRHHAFAIVNGVVYDDGEWVGPQKRLLRAWKFS